MSLCVGEIDVYGCCSKSGVSFKPCVRFIATVVDFVVLLVRIAELSYESPEQPVDLGVVLERLVIKCSACQRNRRVSHMIEVCGVTRKVAWRVTNAMSARNEYALLE